MSDQIYKATITTEGGRTEPYAMLEGEGRWNGKIMPMGHNAYQRIPVGTMGIARYVATRTSGLWLFTADEQTPVIKCGVKHSVSIDGAYTTVTCFCEPGHQGNHMARNMVGGREVWADAAEEVK